MGKYEILSNNKYEVLKCNGYGLYIKNKDTNKYYFTKDNRNIDDQIFTSKQKISWNGIDFIYLCLIIASICSFIFLFFFRYNMIYNCDIEMTFNMYLDSFLFLIVNVVFHELSHFIALKAYKRKPGKIKFKRYYIFFMVVPDTSDSYMLPRYRRFVVYYAGVMINLLAYAFTALIFPEHIYVLRIVLWGVLYNMLPFGGLESDGYHIFVNVMLKINESKGKKQILPLLLKLFFLLFAIITFADSLLNLINISTVCKLLNSVFKKFTY